MGGEKKCDDPAGLNGAGTKITLPLSFVEELCFLVGPKVVIREVVMRANFSEKSFNFHRSL